MKSNPTGMAALPARSQYVCFQRRNTFSGLSAHLPLENICPWPGRERRRTPTFLPLEFAFALLVDKAGSQSAEEDGSRQEADGGNYPSQHWPGQPIVGQVWLREDVCKEGQEHPWVSCLPKFSPPPLTLGP